MEAILSLVKLFVAQVQLAQQVVQVACFAINKTHIFLETVSILID